jgi:predicted metalloprotease
MRWQNRQESDNVEDRRGMGGVGGMGGGGGGMRMPGRRTGLIGGGLGGLIIVLLLLFLGFDPGFLLQGAGGPGVGVPSGFQPPPQQTAPASPGEDTLKRFVGVVLAETEQTWHEVFNELGRRYQEPKLVLFSGQVASACGYAGAATGPFYCPADQKVYLDLSFFEEMQHRFRASGDFAQAYVIAHEIGHHVQTLLGITQQVEAVRQRAGQADANALSVMLELQADCLAGVWAHRMQTSRPILEAGDLEEGLNAANAIGDDRMQRQAQGYVVPDSFTHGSSAQRVRWFKRGLESGDLRACDTFNAPQL